MKINKIRLTGFGNLVNRNFDFNDGLNIVYGPNEAGKSTLQKALLTLLYGFFDEGRITKTTREVRDSYQPWRQGVLYAGELIYELGDLSAFKVSRSFDENYETNIFTFPDGTEITDQFQQSGKGRVFFAEEHIGMSKVVFENTCIIRQTELFSLDSSSADAISETLVQLSTSASTSMNISDAVTNLGISLRDEIGSDRAYTKPYAQVCKKLIELEDEWQRLITLKREFLSKVVEEGQLHKKLSQLEEDINKTTYLQLLADCAAVEADKQKIKIAEQEVNEKKRTLENISNMQAFPFQIRDELLSLQSTHRHQADECKRKKNIAETAQGQIQELNSNISELRGKINAAEAAKNLPEGQLQTLQRMQQQTEVCRSEVENANLRLSDAQKSLVIDLERLEQITLRDVTLPRLAEIRQQWNTNNEILHQTNEVLTRARQAWEQIGMPDEQFLELEKQVSEIKSGIRKPDQRKGCAGWLFSIFRKKSSNQPPVEITVYAQTKPIRDKFIEAQNTWTQAQQESQAIDAEMRNRFGDFINGKITPNVFTRIEQVLEERIRIEASIHQKEEDYKRIENEIQISQNNFERSQAALKNKLQSMGFSGEEIQAEIDTYQAMSQQKAEILSYEKQIDSLSHQIVQAEEQIQQSLDAEKTFQNTQNTIFSLLKKASIETNDIDSTFDLFEAKYQEYLKWKQAQAMLKSATEQYSAIREKLNIEVLEQQIQELEVQINKARNKRKEWSNLKPEKTYRQYEEQLRDLNQRKAQTQQDLVALQVEMKRLSSNIKHPAELLENIQQTKERRNKLEIYRSALELAISELNAATQIFNRQFAPRIEELMQRGLKKITNERYSRVNVDPKTLEVTVVSPELGKSVGVHQLSTGTQDLLYIMLRMSITQQMSNTGEVLPLLLDDPFVHFDQKRLETALTYLVELSKQTQIIFFTMRNDIQQFFADLKPNVSEMSI